MLFFASSSRYRVYVICGACSARALESWISATGTSRMSIQNESVLEKRPQLKSFLFFGGIGPGIYCKLAM
jgi:hypothetical protein